PRRRRSPGSSTGPRWSTRSASTPSPPSENGEPELDLRPDPALACPPDGGRADRDVPGCEAVRLEDDDVVVRLPARELTGDDFLELVHLEPVKHPRLHRLDQGARLQPRLLDRVAADQPAAPQDAGVRA